MKKVQSALTVMLLTAALVLSAGCGKVAPPSPDSSDAETGRPGAPSSAAAQPDAPASTQPGTQNSTRSSAPPGTQSTARPTTQPTTRPTTQPTTQPKTGSVYPTLQQMTLHEKIGQLFIIRPDALEVSRGSRSSAAVTALSPAMAATLKAYPAGGVILFSGNIRDPKQLVGFIGALQDASAIPLFMGIDEEGGRVARLANHPAFDLPRYESAAAVGSSGEPSDALAMGAAIGAYLHRYGFNMDFAPVADVNTNRDNPIIGSRAFSSDAAAVQTMAKAMADGLKQQRIIPVYKHFPGHGDTAEDSHRKLAVNRKTKEEMEGCEWLPYASLTDGDCMMVGHIATPEITGDLTPASLSPAIVGGVVRRRLGFDGLVITDALDMGAITNDHDPGEAAVQAIRAGCDILLGPEDYRKAFDAVVGAVKAGVISEERIDESVSRILRFKQAYGSSGAAGLEPAAG